MWQNENTYNAVIQSAADRYRVPVSVIKGVIGLESGFDPHAKRLEPQLPAVNIPGLESGGDASYGLMQLLYRTAWGMGYRGPSSGLYDPSVNVPLGTAFLADALHSATVHGYGLDSALSVYNAGGSRDRPGDGKRMTQRADGRVSAGGPLAPFVNQAYVDRVLSYVRYFDAQGGAGNVTVGVPTIPAGSTSLGIIGALVGIGALVFFFRYAPDDPGGKGLLAAAMSAEGGLLWWFFRQSWAQMHERLDKIEKTVGGIEGLVMQLASSQGLVVAQPGQPFFIERRRQQVGNANPAD